MSTGHCSTHAPQVVQDHSTSSSMTSGTSGLAATPSSLRAVSPPSDLDLAAASSSGPAANSCSRRSMINSFGDSGLSVAQAGHWSWQRPHSVQLIRSSRCFQVRWAICPVPKTVSSVIFSGSRSGVVAERAERLGPAGEEHVRLGHEDVHVLGMQHEHEESPDHDELEDEEGRLDVHVGGRALRPRRRPRSPRDANGHQDLP